MGDTERTDYRRLVQRDYLGQWDLQLPDGRYRKAVVEISSVALYVPRERRRVKTGADASGKPIYEPERLKRLKITFKGQRKAWLAGPVSQQIIAKLFGPIVQDWIGKRIELYVDPTVRMGRSVVGGVRPTERSPDARVQTTEEQLDNDAPEELVAALDEAFGKEEET